MLQVGVDCEQISRFRRLSYGRNKRFYKKIFTPQEIKYCRSFRDPYPRFAARFAAKEATIKALNNIARPFYADIEVKKGSNEQPEICLDKKKFKNVSCFNIALSLTHSNTHAIAFTAVSDGKFNSKKINLTLREAASCVRAKPGR
ncbi:MAG: holo-ACP synthase [Candidatus Omnitrophica bacterium]|nr:holo-ACP synthase [Candidatus Omnitrophota bacterium]